MAELSAGVLSDGIAAETKVREEKIPVEVKERDGTVRHPSGFEPPTPETDFHPDFSERSDIRTSSWDSPSRSAKYASQPEEVVPPYYIERKRQRESISERKEEEGSLMAELSAGILSEGLAAQTRHREEKIPVEVEIKDGVVLHPSGFVPPTPE
ncbi:hypothetical protein CERSUDRAFT_53131, partial [Gelatoporia subvermispora B]